MKLKDLDWVPKTHPRDTPPTRAWLQAQIDLDFANKTIDKEIWSKRFDELSKLEELSDDSNSKPAENKTDNGGEGAKGVPA